MAETIETRPFPPFLPKNTTVMMMGTFPPTSEKRSMEFHYPNFQNDMWRVYGLVFFDDKEHFRKGEEKAFESYGGTCRRLWEKFFKSANRLLRIYA